MGATEFGQLVAERMTERGLSQNRLASRLGELSDGRIFDATQVRMLREGRRRLDQELVQRLIDVLDLDPAEAWAAAGLLPPGTDAEALRRTGLVATAGAAAEQARASMPPDSAPAGERRWGTDRRRRCPVRPLRLVPVPLPDLVPGRWAA